MELRLQFWKVWTPSTTGLRWFSRLIGKLQTRGFHPDPARMELAIRATRTTTLSIAVLWFITLLTLDDLGILALPAYFIAVGGALTIFALGPIVAGRRLTFRHRKTSDTNFASKAAQHGRAGNITLTATLLLTLLWLVMFTAGVPPWAG